MVTEQEEEEKSRTLGVGCAPCEGCRLLRLIYFVEENKLFDGSSPQQVTDLLNLDVELLSNEEAMSRLKQIRFCTT